MKKSREIGRLTTTEKLAYQWLLKSYAPEDIRRYANSSPDFRTSDNKGWEVKPARNGVVTFGIEQIKSLRNFYKENKEGCFLIIYNTDSPPDEPSAIIRFDEVAIPGYGKGYQFKAPLERVAVTKQTAKTRSIITTENDSYRYLLKELSQAEDNLLIAEEGLRLAEIRRAIALTAFCATRDYAKQELGVSPYSERAKEYYLINNPSIYKFRFSRMGFKDAMLEILEEQGSIPSDNLIEQMMQGGSEIRTEHELTDAILSLAQTYRKANKVIFNPDLVQKEEEVT